MKIHLLSIDPQNDFVLPDGNLTVPGAEDDMKRLASFVDDNIKRIDDIHVTLDSHLPLHIAHPQMWIDAEGNHPYPFTLINRDEVRDGKWRTVVPLMYDDPDDGRMTWGEYYTKKLADNGRYVLCIWPPHCLIGTPGHNIYGALSDVLIKWQLERTGLVHYVTKGSNFKTEHYSAVEADVVIPNDDTTQLNMDLITMLQDAEISDILISGEALSHCVKNTVEDIANNFGEENIKKFVLLEDTCSNVPSFEVLGEEFVTNMTARGMRVSTTTDYFA